MVKPSHRIITLTAIAALVSLAISHGAVRTETSEFWSLMKAGTEQSIVYMGSSLSKYSGEPADGAHWPNELDNQLHDHFGDAFVSKSDHYSARSGGTTRSGLENTVFTVINRKPDAVTIEYLGNDCRDSRGIPLEEYAANLGAIIDTLRANLPGVELFIYEVGDTMVIAWSKDETRVTEVEVDISTNGGQSYTAITSEALLEDSLAWIIPLFQSDLMLAGTELIIRVSDYMQQYPPVYSASISIADEIVIVDNNDSETSRRGVWNTSDATGGHLGGDYAHDNNESQGDKTFTFTPAVPVAGMYEVALIWTSHDNRSSLVPVTVVHADGEDSQVVNQQTGGGQWNVLGAYPFAPGSPASITIRNDGANGYVIADGVRLRLLPSDHPSGVFFSPRPSPSIPRRGHAAGPVRCYDLRGRRYRTRPRTTAGSALLEARPGAPVRRRLLLRQPFLRHPATIAICTAGCHRPACLIMLFCIARRRTASPIAFHRPTAPQQKAFSTEIYLAQPTRGAPLMTIDHLPATLVLLATLVAGAILYRLTSRWWRALRMKMRFRRGHAGEAKARRYLLRHGYRILAEEAVLNPIMRIDGERFAYTVRADFLVQKGGKRAVVEAKTGAAARPASSDTRRQLLEYAMYYDVDRVFLYDGNRDALVEIGFDTRLTSPRHGTGLLPWIVGFVCGAGAAWAVVLVR